MSNKYTKLDFHNGYHRVEYCENETVGLKAWIAIHNTNRGPSLGGCRLWNYQNRDDGLIDVLRLSKGMTYKNALAGLDLGGGKSVMWGTQQQKTPDYLRAMGEFVEYMGGEYIVAEDVGMTANDIRIMREVTEYTCDPDIGDPGPYTARGVLRGIEAACRHKFGSDDLKDMKILVQGAGSVGMGIIVALKTAGAHVHVVDINQGNLLKAMAHGAVPLLEDEMHEKNCQIYVPCALGGILTTNSTYRLRSYDIIAGSANNQLLSEGVGDDLKFNGILYAPDFVINAGGVIMVAEGQKGNFDQATTLAKIDALGNVLKEIFERSENENLATNVIANRMAEERF